MKQINYFIPSIAVLILLFHKIDSFDYLCIPDRDCSASDIPGIKVPDPMNCNNYYQCLNDPPFMVASDSPLKCPEGQYFDTIVTADCIDDNGIPCDNTCDVPPNFTCYSECTTDGNLYFADPDDCSIYYVCGTDYEKVPCSVSPNFYFNGTVCIDDERYCCDLCDAYCTELFVEIADPNDCQKFYICLQLGVATEDMHASCPDGQHFDPDTADCTPGANCSPFCGASKTTAVPTTTVPTTTVPTTTVPTTTVPTTTVPTTTVPTTTVPTTTVPTTTVPTTTVPTTTVPTTTVPTTTVPTTTVPTTTVPTTTVPTTTVPTTTVPTTTVPTTTVPTTTVPTTTAPTTTVPTTTASTTTVPTTTVPTTTVPTTTVPTTTEPITTTHITKSSTPTGNSKTISTSSMSAHSTRATTAKPPSKYTCIPYKDCKASMIQGVKVPDPLDCTKYYQCLGSPPTMYPSDSPLSCQEGKYFDIDVEDCIDDNGKPCFDSCAVDPNYGCESICRHGNTYAGDPDSCNIFYFCPPNIGDFVGPEITCKNEPYSYFNGTMCQEDARQCCNLCDAYCTELFKEIPDPNDCRKFFFCTDFGVATEDMHADCPQGEYFDRLESLCVPGSNCNPLCGAIRISTTTISSTEPFTGPTSIATTTSGSAGADIENPLFH